MVKSGSTLRANRVGAVRASKWRIAVRDWRAVNTRVVQRARVLPVTVCARVASRRVARGAQHWQSCTVIDFAAEGADSVCQMAACLLFKLARNASCRTW